MDIIAPLLLGIGGLIVGGIVLTFAFDGIISVAANVLRDIGKEIRISGW
jgi:hypothetical protein